VDIATLVLAAIAILAFGVLLAWAGLTRYPLVITIALLTFVAMILGSKSPDVLVLASVGFGALTAVITKRYGADGKEESPTEETDYVPPFPGIGRKKTTPPQELPGEPVDESDLNGGS
jgi:hypothetical protein